MVSAFAFQSLEIQEQLLKKNVARMYSYLLQDYYHFFFNANFASSVMAEKPMCHHHNAVHQSCTIVLLTTNALLTAGGVTERMIVLMERVILILIIVTSGARFFFLSTCAQNWKYCLKEFWEKYREKNESQNLTQQFWDFLLCEFWTHILKIVSNYWRIIYLDENNCGERGACREGHFACNSTNACIPDKWKCDAEEDCKDGSGKELIEPCNWQNPNKKYNLFR